MPRANSPGPRADIPRVPGGHPAVPVRTSRGSRADIPRVPGGHPARLPCGHPADPVRTSRGSRADIPRAAAPVAAAPTRSSSQDAGGRAPKALSVPAALGELFRQDPAVRQPAKLCPAGRSRREDLARRGRDAARVRVESVDAVVRPTDVRAFERIANAPAVGCGLVRATARRLAAGCTAALHVELDAAGAHPDGKKPEQRPPAKAHAPASARWPLPVKVRALCGERDRPEAPGPSRPMGPETGPALPLRGQGIRFRAGCAASPSPAWPDFGCRSLCPSPRLA